MKPRTLTGIERAIRRSWSEDTCAPEDRIGWQPGNPARGQCGVTALWSTTCWVVTSCAVRPRRRAAR
ncbi:YunG family protein [Amycolatopsis carbonis]|uniref:YunG family protein n=1 Tax=Amycolatopsis carbonis TaxID=715471 RepID=UPI003DA71FF0